MVYVVFEKAPGGPGSRKYIAGPYANAQLFNGRLWVAGPAPRKRSAWRSRPAPAGGFTTGWARTATPAAA